MDSTVTYTDGLLTNVTTPDGGSTTLSYNNSGLLASITEPGDRVVTLVHNDSGDLTTIVSAAGYSRVMSYNSDHLLTQDQWSPYDTTFSYDADGDGNLIKQTDPNGNVSTYAYDALGDQTQSTLGSATATDSYDGNGNLTLSIDPDGNSTAYQYDADGNLTLEIDGYGTNAATQTSYAYDASGNQTLMVQGYDSSNPESTSYGYDANDNQTLMVTGYGTTQAVTTTSQYDGDGNLIKQTDPDDNVSDYAYDSLGDQTLSILGAGSSNPGTSHDYYDGDDNLTLSVNAVGDSTSYEYDADGNQTLEIDGYGTSSASTIHYIYDAAGNQIQEIDPDGNTTSYEYDADGNQTLMIQAYGTSDKTSTSYQYDKDGNLTLQTNPNGTSIESSYNDQGEVTSELWCTGSTETNSISYTYDADGNMLTASNDAGSYSFAYNADGEETLAIEPYGVTLNYQYDAVGNVTQITDSLGDTITSLYDANDNLTQRSATGPNSAQIAVDMTYDGDGNPTTLERYGQVNGTMQMVGGETETYDAQGNLTYIVQSNASGSTLDSFSYSYDAADELTKEVDYNTGTTDYSYDATGQLIAAGSTTYSYDANGNPNNSGDSIDPNNELLSDGTWNYSYDANGNNTGKVGVSGGPDAGLSWTYSYDAANELIEAKETNSLDQTLEQTSYTYDVFGDLISSSVSLNGGAATVTHYAYNGSTLWATETASNVIEDLYVSGDQPDQYFAQIDATAGAGWYLNDHLNTPRDVMNNSGQLEDTLDYGPYGLLISQTNASAQPVIGFTGIQVMAGLGFDETNVRVYNPQTGRWEQQDPTYLNAGPNTYEYANDAPTIWTDPSGEEPIGGQQTPEQQYLDGLHEGIRRLTNEQRAQLARSGFGNKVYQYVTDNKQKIQSGLLRLTESLQKLEVLVQDTSLAPAKKYEQSLRGQLSALKNYLTNDNLDPLELLIAQGMLSGITQFVALGRYQQQVAIYRASLNPLEQARYDQARKSRQREPYQNEQTGDYNEAVAAAEYSNVIYGKFGGKPLTPQQQIGPAPGTPEYDKYAQAKRFDHYDEMRRTGAGELRILWEMVKLDPRMNQAFLPEGPADQMVLALAGVAPGVVPMLGTSVPELVNKAKPATGTVPEPPGRPAPELKPEQEVVRPEPIAPKRIPGSSDAEHAIDQYLQGKGLKVEPNPAEGAAGAGRQGDRFVNGVKTEYKSLDPGATSSTIRNTVNNSIRKGGQARQIVIDARGSGLTQEQAAEGIKRAMGISRGKVDQIRVIGDGFDITN